MKRMFKSLWGFISNRWVVTIIGLIAFIALVWFGGPLLAIAGKEPFASRESRLFFLGLIALIFGLYHFIQRQRLDKKNAGIINEIEENVDQSNEDPVDQREQEEVATLKGTMHQALETLGSAKNSKSLYELPWYMMIGPPGSGKTTVLLNSGLSFPLQKKLGQDTVKGVGGTRYCDWWFTDQAVLIDTAGRYTLQDSHERVDKSGWHGFLNLLKEHRPRRPINGVMVVISLPDIASQSVEINSLHAKSIRERIQELNNQLGIDIPVYVVLSKVDLLAGFTETFDSLSKEEREQVWGMTFPNQAKPDEPLVGGFNKEFSDLLKRLHERVYSLMLRENNVQRRSFVYDFPTQLRTAQHNLNEFLGEVFASNRYENVPMLRGIYLTSATQQGTPVDRIMKRLTKGFGMSPSVSQRQVGTSKGYFIKRLLDDVIFAESELAGTDRKYERRQRWFKIAAYAACLVGCIGIIALWANSYSQNKNFVQEVENSMDAYEDLTEGGLTTSSNVEVMNEGLIKLRTMSSEYSEAISSPPFQMGFGLYQGDKLGRQATAAYDKANSQYFAPYIKELLELQILDSGDNYDISYEALKVYLMLYKEEKLDVDFVRAWLSLSWQQLFNTDSEDSIVEDLIFHFDALMNNDAVFPEMNTRLVEQTRTQLLSLSLPELIYRRLKQESNQTNNVSEFRLTNFLSSRAQQVFKRRSGRALSEPIEPLFTHAGFYSLFLVHNKRLSSLLKKERWVLYDQEDEASTLTDEELELLSSQVSQLYYDEYIYIWRDLVNDLDVHSFSTAAEGAAILSALTGAEKPLSTVFKQIKKQVELTRIPGADKLAKAAKIKDGLPVTRLESRFNSKTNRLQRLLPNNSNGLSSISLPGHEVESAFTDIIEFAGDENNSPIDNLTVAIDELRQHLDGLENAAIQGQQALSDQQNIAQAGRAANELKRIAPDSPSPVGNWLTQMADQSSKVTSSGALEFLNGLWQSEVYDICRQTISDKYPFEKLSSDEVTLDDFGLFFGYGGVMDNFFNEHLKVLVDTSVTPWEFSRHLSSHNDSLIAFYRAKKIRETFFVPGSQVPRVKFSLKPTLLTKEAAGMQLDIDGQLVKYRHGPATPTNIVWPGEAAVGKARLAFNDFNGNDTANRQFEGPWAWFRLLDSGSIKSTSGYNRYTVNLPVKTHLAQFELRANSVKNPFKLNDINKFSCRRSL